MPDIKDLIERTKPSWANDVAISHVQQELRADGGSTGADIIGQYIVDSNSVRREAASALSRLEQENAELREALTRIEHALYDESNPMERMSDRIEKIDAILVKRVARALTKESIDAKG